MSRTISGIAPISQELERLDPDGSLNQIRKFLIGLNAGRIAVEGTSSSNTGGSPVPGPAGPAGPPGAPGGSSDPDLTAPPTPSGVSVTAGLDYIFITTDAPTFSEGHGYNRTLVYYTTYGGIGPLPTFGDAVLGHEFVGQVGSFAGPPGVQYHVWLKWRTNDGVLSASPQGGANGNQATTSLIGGVNIAPLAIEAANLANGSVTAAKVAALAIDLTKFANGIEPIAQVSSVPLVLTTKTIFNTTDGKLYRWNGTAYVSSVATTDLTGTITSAQIAAFAIDQTKFASGIEPVGVVASLPSPIGYTGPKTVLLTSDGKLYRYISGAWTKAVDGTDLVANSITAGSIAAGAINTTQLAANAVTAAKIAAGTITAVEIQAGSLTTATMTANSINGDRILANTLDAGKITANSITAGQIQAFAIGAGQIAAGAITTDKLLVTGRGAAINDDPNTIDLTAWSGGTFLIVADTSSPTGSALNVTSTGATTLSRLMTLDASKNYNLRMTAKQVSGTSTCYLLVAFYDATGALIAGDSFVSGWPAAGTFNYFGLVSAQPPGSYTEYRISFGPNETAQIAPGAVSCRIGMLANYVGTGVQRFTSLRLMEKATADLIVDGSIIATKLAANAIAVGTAAIQNGAIINAMIGDAQISSAKIVSLSASKILAGSIAVGEYIQSSDFSTGISGWRFGGNTAELGAANIRGQLTASQIDGRSLIIRDAAGTPILGVGTGLSAAYFAATIGGANSLLNASFEVDTDANGLADSWSEFVGSGGDGSRVTALTRPAALYGAGVCQRLQITSAGNLNDSGILQSFTGVAAGQKWSASTYMRSNSSGAFVLLRFIDGGGTSTLDVASSNTVGGAAAVRLSCSGIAPSGTVGIQIMVRGLDEPGEWFEVDAVQAEPGDVVTAFAVAAADKVGIDNPVTAANASTYIASAAIGWAQIGNLNINTNGAIRSGQTAYDTGTGYYLGLDGGVPRLSIGSATRALLWDGSSLSVRGDIIATGNIQANAATEVYSATVSSATVTELQFIPESLGVFTRVAFVTFTPGASGTALLHFSGQLNYGAGAGLGGDALGMLADAAIPGSGAPFPASTGIHILSLGYAPASTTLQTPISVTREIPVTGGVSYTFGMYVAKLNSGDTVTIENGEIRAEVVKR